MSPGAPPISIAVLTRPAAARTRWAVYDADDVVAVHTHGQRAVAASAVVLDLLDADDPVATAQDARVHPGEEVVVLAAEAQVAALRDAGFETVVSSPQLAVLRAVTIAATAALHDGPIQSLTVARLRLSLAAAHPDDETDRLEDLDEVLSAAAAGLAGVVDALRVARLSDEVAPTVSCGSDGQP